MIFKQHWLGLMFIFGVVNVVGLPLLYTITEALWYFDIYDGVFLNWTIAILIYFTLPFIALKLTLFKEVDTKYTICMSVLTMVLSFIIWILLNVLLVS
jgi:hypothetical protein